MVFSGKKAYANMNAPKYCHECKWVFLGWCRIVSCFLGGPKKIYKVGTQLSLWIQPAAYNQRSNYILA